MSGKIPSPIIGVLGKIFSDHYTHSDIDRLFTYADAPGDAPDENKVKKTVEWLRRIFARDMRDWLSIRRTRWQHTFLNACQTVSDRCGA